MREYKDLRYIVNQLNISYLKNLLPIEFGNNPANNKNIDGLKCATK